MAAPTRFAGIIGLCLIGATQTLVFAQGTNAPAPSRFMRFVQTTENEGHVDTAISRYARADGVSVDLIAAVHIADQQYYKSLNRRFTNYDVVLYEMVKPDDVAPTPSQHSDNPVSALQNGMKRLLGLEFQLDAIDYAATNFVHADMSPETFVQAQAANGESILGLMLRAILTEQARQAASPNQPDGLQMIMALFSKDSDYKLKFLFAQQLESMEALLSGIDQSPGGKGSVLVSGRNQVAMRVLTEQIQLGKRKLAIFYGAGHMPDFERRLGESGFKKSSEEWLTSWDVQKPKR